MEALRILADARPATNHYVSKAANILDRTMRAKGTTAKGAADKTIREHYEAAGPRRHSQERGAESNVIPRVPAIQLKTPFLVFYDITHKFHCEIAQSRFTPGADVKTQESIYMAKDELIASDPKASHLIYQRNVNRNLTTHEKALSVLRNIGWVPGVTVDSNQFPEFNGPETRWEKLKWNTGEKDQAEEKESLDKDPT